VFIIPMFIFRNRIGWNTKGDDLVLLPGGLVLVAIWSWIFTWSGPVWFTLVGYAGYLLIKRYVKGINAEWATAGWIAVITLLFTWYAYTYLPPRDYRPYAEGRNIPEQKVMGRPPVQEIYMLYRNKTTGQVEEFNASGAYPWDDDNYEYVDRRIVEVEPGIISPVQDFILSDIDGYDMTDDLLNEPTPVILVMMYNVATANTGCMDEIRSLAEVASANGWYVYGVSSSPFTRIEEVRHEHQLPFDFVQADEKVIKTAIRSNPGIMLMQQGTVLGNWSCAATPSFEEARQRIPN
jgi:peroxiredoxin